MADPARYAQNISHSGLSIYDPIEIGDPELWIPSPELESLLDEGLSGISLEGLPLRTRSKRVKEEVCSLLGYPTPKSFKKTQPRFPGQNFDIYTQKSNNLQIWNEDISPSRRYVIIQISDNYQIKRVKVVSGVTLAKLDTTGALTSKYQARLVPGAETTELISRSDSEQVDSLISADAISKISHRSPIDEPAVGEVMPISSVYGALAKLVGQSFADAGYDQERNRGATLHRLVCETLGYEDYRDSGRFPDVRHQLLEVKLQTSPTIDLGLISPDSEEPLDMSKINGIQVRHCDVRYALFYAETDGEDVNLTHLFLANGADFFGRFEKFQGRVLNQKIQIPLPANFFD